MVHLQLVEKLLIAAVADADITVRQSIFSSLHGNRGFDNFLAQADSLTAVFAALNDEVCMWLLDLLHLMEDFHEYAILLRQINFYHQLICSGKCI